MTFTDAAAEVLRLIGRPLHYKEITDIAIEKNLLSHVGKSPEVTMGARLAAMLKKDSSDTPLIRVKPGVFALREWDEKTLRAGADGKKGRTRGGRQDTHAKRPEAEVGHDGAAAATEAVDDAADDGADDTTEEASDATSEPVEQAEVAVPTPVAAADDDDDDEVIVAAPAPVPVAAPVAPPAPRASAPSVVRRHEEDADAEPAGPDDVMRAEAVAGAAEMFDEEEDDDQPILGGGDERPGAGPADGADGRRRRRRRRRGRSTNGEQQPGDRKSVV